MIQHDILKKEELTMTQIQYRSARPEDVPEMADLFLEAVSDMYARNNITAAVPPRPPDPPPPVPGASPSIRPRRR